MKRLFISLLLLAPLAVQAAVGLPGILSDHAVLQRSERTAIWGTAAPGEKVLIALGASLKKETTAGDKGKWRVELDLRNCGNGPFDLMIQGGNTLTIHDIIIGDVWICSGQSNMEFKLSKTIDGDEEIARSTNTLLRCFLPKRQAVGTPAENLEGQWVVASPNTSGGFSGVGYYFGKTVQASQHIPIGLVDTSWGGTPAEAWISSSGLDGKPDLKARKDSILAERPQSDEKVKNFGGAFKDWAAINQREDHPVGNPADFAGPDVPVDDWKTLSLPGLLSASGLPDSGVVWLRREVDIPANRAGTYLPLLLGTLHDFETVYWNGKKIGETTPLNSTSMNPDLTATTNRRYDVPGDLVKPGKNILAIRLVSPGGSAGLEASRFVAGWSIPLAGPWRAKVESEFPPLPAEAKASYPHRPPWPAMPHYTATYLSNGMLHPLIPLSLRGVIWYQGEANVGRACQYRETFPLLIQDWRRQLQKDDIPFYFCQLANYLPKKSIPGESAWAELREAQALALAQPHTGMAVLIDLGEEDDIHFRNKKEAGERLAAVALAETYGQKIPAAGPAFLSSEITGTKIILHFKDIDGGLVAKPLPETYRPKSGLPATRPLVKNAPASELQGFAICGDDHVWKWAEARIAGDTVEVWSPSVAAPKYVRYAWADNPTCNLYNGAGFPAVPFRTDALPAITANAKF